MSAAAEQTLDTLIAAAEAGRDAPYVSGRQFVLWGALVALALSAQAGLEAWRPPGVGAWAIGVWASMGLVGGGLSAVLGAAAARKPGANTMLNRIGRAVWISAGLGIGGFAVGVIGYNAVQDAPTLALYDLILPTAFVFYAGAYGVSAQFTPAAWPRLGALACGLSAIAGFSLIGSAWLYPVAALAMIPVAILPGLWLMAREPKASAPDHG
ncbi:MAG: hypothetical protein ACFB2Z_12945 [Maricaulaceae bacterium]